MEKVFLTEHIHPDAVAYLRENFEVVQGTSTESGEIIRQAQAQIPEIYDTALEHYGENRFSAAMEWLEIIPDYENYEDAFVYVEACKAHTVLSENYYTTNLPSTQYKNYMA